MHRQTLVEFEAYWEASGTTRYLPILEPRIDALVSRITAGVRHDYEDFLGNESEFTDGLAREAFSITEMLAQFCSGGISWYLTDKSRFLAPTVDLLTIIETRDSSLRNSFRWAKYRKYISAGTYDFLKASELTLGWFEALDFPDEELAYILWASKKALSLLHAKERIPDFTQIALKDTLVLNGLKKCESPIESILFMQLVVLGLRPPTLQSQFWVENYRLDFALPDGLIAIECDGRQFHNKASDAERDKKLNRLGWTVLRFDSIKIKERVEDCVSDIHDHYPWKKIQ